LFRNKRNRDTLRKLMAVTVVMMGLPLLVFQYVGRVVVPDSPPNERMLYAGVAAVCTVQLVLVAFIFYAFCIEKIDDEDRKSDKAD
jgi:uncharacterized membrane protein